MIGINVNALRVHCVAHRRRYFPNRVHQRGERFIVGVKNVLYRFFRYHERVPRRRRLDIKKGECVGILVDNLGGNLMPNNFHKNSVFHPASIQ